MGNLVDLLGFPSVNLILGKRGSGKSAFGYRVLEDAHERGYPCFVLGLPREKRALLPGWIEPVEDPRELRDDSAIFCDEAYMLWFARESMGKFNKLMAKLVGITRQRNQLFMFATHLTRKLDVGIIYDADNLVFRQPSHLHSRFERSELHPMLKEADRFFRGLDDDPVRWAYVISERGTFRVRVELPSFWSDGLSRAFAAVSLAPEAGGMEGKPRLTEWDRVILRRILEVEERGDYYRNWGWEAKQVGAAPHQIQKFLALGLIRPGIHSRTSKGYFANVENIRAELGEEKPIGRSLGRGREMD